MVQSINRIHTQNTALTHTDDCFYIYNDGLWKKASTNYYKYFDTNISDLDANSFNLNDYIISYKSKTNHIKFSEVFDPDLCKINNTSLWTICGLSQSSKDENYRFPNTGKNSTKFQTNNDIRYEVSPNVFRYKELNEPIEHSIGQIFYTNSKELYIASCLVKQVASSTSNLALQFYDDTYDIGITAKYNLNNTSGYDTYGYKSVPIEYMDTNFNRITSNPVINHLYNVSAGIYRISDGVENYFRLVIKFSCDFTSLIRLKFYILNNNSNFKYTSKQGEEKYVIYANGFQLEKYSNLNVSSPSEYMITNEKPSTMKLLDKIYKVQNNPSTSRKEIEEVRNKLYYIYNITERSEIIHGIGLATYLESFSPAINYPINGDIAVVPSMISFSPNIKYQISKIFNNYASIGRYYEDNAESPLDGQIILVKSDERNGGKESMYQYKNKTWVRLAYEDSIVQFGDRFVSENPSETINYDIINSQYIIKRGNSYKILSYLSEEKNRKSMVKAMIFNQGYFETWCKHERDGIYKFGYNTGGGLNYSRLFKLFPKL